MTTFFKPLLSGKADPSKLRFPLIASPKVDGIRCICHPTLGPVTRSLKPIPNHFVRTTLANPAYHYLDGELVVGSPTDPMAFNKTTSIMAHHGEPDFTFWCFDRTQYPQATYSDRLEKLSMAIRPPKCELLPHRHIKDYLELSSYEEDCLTAGFEGVMLRDPNGHYKFGRSTTREGILLKLKRFEDAEATIIGFEERMHNANEQTTSELGYAKRSSAAEGLVPTGTLGAFIVSHPKWGTFNIGSGFTEAQRQEFWQNRSILLQTSVTFKYQPHGMLLKPRTPIFRRLRPQE